MSLEGTAQTEYASLSGKIHTLVIDKTLSISGACADSKAVGDKIADLQAVTIPEVEEIVAKHERRADNPHKVKAEQTGAVPADAIQPGQAPFFDFDGVWIGRDTWYTQKQTISNENYDRFFNAYNWDISTPSDLWPKLLDYIEEMAKAKCGSYIGTGTSKVSLTLPFVPTLLLIDSGEIVFSFKDGAYADYRRDKSYTDGNSITDITLSGKTLSWMGRDGAGGDASVACNVEGQTYTWVAIR